MTTRALVSFIEREQGKGTPRGAITAMLQERGWAERDIESAFAAILEADDGTIPAPCKGTIGEFCGILSLMWRVYTSRWKRFFGIGILYSVFLVYIELAFRMWFLPEMPTFARFVVSGDVVSAFSFVAPYLAVGIFGYVLLQLWYVGTTYAIALKKGNSLIERGRLGLLHLPMVLGIKVVVALLVIFSFIPVVAAAFFTSNVLVLIVFGPFFIFGAIALGFLLSFSLPAYFHGVPWREAALHSIRVVHQNALPILKFYACFGVALFILFGVVRSSGFVVGPLTIGLIIPMQTLFMLALYRRFVPAFPEERASFSLPEESSKKAEKKVRRTGKAPSA